MATLLLTLEATARTNATGSSTVEEHTGRTDRDERVRVVMVDRHLGGRWQGGGVEGLLLLLMVMRLVRRWRRLLMMGRRMARWIVRITMLGRGGMVWLVVVVLGQMVMVRLELYTGEIETAQAFGQWWQSGKRHYDAFEM